MPTFDDHLKQIIGEIREEIRNSPSLPNVQQLINHYSLPEIEIDKTREVKINQRLDGLWYISVPVKPNDKLQEVLEYHPVAYANIHMHYEREGYIVSNVLEDSENLIRSCVQNILSNIRSWNEAIRRFNRQLEEIIPRLIQNERELRQKKEKKISELQRIAQEEFDKLTEEQSE